mmetsp:Transcript_12981/g.30517  ORF Transcript_12981/g.30517 Transcript_12981/m.30517 type:complete len:279 (+) Transcript_12981:96-932(+)
MPRASKHDLRIFANGMGVALQYSRGSVVGLYSSDIPLSVVSSRSASQPVSQSAGQPISSLASQPVSSLASQLVSEHRRICMAREEVTVPPLEQHPLRLHKSPAPAVYIVLLRRVLIRPLRTEPLKATPARNEAHHAARQHRTIVRCVRCVRCTGYLAQDLALARSGYISRRSKQGGGTLVATHHLKHAEIEIPTITYHTAGHLLAKVANHLVRTSRCAAQTRQNRHACVMVPRALKQRQPLLPPEPDGGGIESHRGGVEADRRGVDEREGEGHARLVV